MNKMAISPCAIAAGTLVAAACLALQKDSGKEATDILEDTEIK